MNSPRCVFWMVWSPSTGEPPEHGFTSERLALAEAERRARQMPGADFFVLRAVSRTSAMRVETVALELNVDCGSTF